MWRLPSLAQAYRDRIGSVSSVNCEGNNNRSKVTAMCHDWPSLVYPPELEFSGYTWIEEVSIGEVRYVKTGFSLKNILSFYLFHLWYMIK
jgi:hypothetical protein